MKRMRLRGILSVYMTGLLVSILTCFRAAAHEPFDVSTRVTVYADRIEVVSTLGAEGARHFLNAAGVVEEKITESLKARGPESPVVQSKAIAAKFFQVRQGNQMLDTRAISTLSEGMEVLVTLVYPRPASGALTLRATCYETAPRLRHGAVFVCASDGGQLGAALLSAKRKELSFQLPAPR